MSWLMYEDPALKKPLIEKRYTPRLVDVWLEALARPEREMKRRAAFAIAEGVSTGVPGLDATIVPLSALLRDPDEDRIVRLTVARALTALDARDLASQLIEAASPNDLEMAEVVEPAMARWKDAGLRDRWMERLNSEVGLRRFHVLAIRGLTALGDEEAVPRLRELAFDPHVPDDVRLEAADALGVLQKSGLLEPALKLCEDKSIGAVVDRLVAVRMLAGHRGKETEKVLVRLATDPQPSVAAVALGHLFQIDPSLILPIVKEIAGSKDANVRRWAAETLVAKPSPELLAVLGPMLDDHDPDIRRYVCDSLVRLAENPALRDATIEQGRRVLNGESWRGQEQATLLLVTLEDTTVVERLIELLDAKRPEANVTAAWGLCQLAVPATAEPIHGVLLQKTDSWLAGDPQNDGVDDQLALLSQALAVMDYTPADPVLRKYIRKGSGLGDVSRSASIWALGKLHAGQPDDQLASLLEKRVLDAFSEMPESWLVSRMSAVSLGRMKADKALPSLRSGLAQASVDSDVGYACAWAISQLTDEEIPPLEPNVFWEPNDFLTPAVSP